MAGKKSWNAGLTKHTDIRVKEIGRKAGETHKRNKKSVSKETREKLSEHGKRNLAKRYADGWQPKAGRCKKIDYFSRIAGQVKLDGTWELIVAQWFDKCNINWQRNQTRFEYINLNGKTSHYTPDFYLIDTDCYLEVKGYETDLDRCKWSQFEHKLKVWKSDDISSIRKQLQAIILIPSK